MSNSVLMGTAAALPEARFFTSALYSASVWATALTMSSGTGTPYFRYVL